MLLRFAVENFASFRDRTELTFDSTARKDEPTHRIPSRHARHGVLPVLGLWGANAAGKSNIIGALTCARDLIAQSFASGQPDGTAPWAPWLMRTDAGAPPTTFELDTLVGGDVLFEYGFRQDHRGFVKEWLFRRQGARRQAVFLRDREAEQPWYFGPSWRGQRQPIVDATRTNALFLSAAAQFNHAELLPAFQAMTTGIRAEREIRLQGLPLFAPNSPQLTVSGRKNFARILAQADTGIVAVDLQPDDGQRRGQKVPLIMHHRVGAGETWLAPPELESRGTHIFAARLYDFVEALSTGTFLIADELETSLHPDLCTELIRMFTSPSTNPHGAQLLFTTHNRDLLTGLRTDEVALVDKHHDGHSTLRYASDYKGVRTRDDLRRAHELGQLRGVPVLGDLQEVMQGVVADAR